MTINSLRFLCSTLHHFQKAGIALWIFGGWAEELWQMIPARQHNDIDLLYPAPSFEPLDYAITSESSFSEIPEKHFPHKRAIILDDVLLEFILIQRSKLRFVTSFFDGQYRLQWPADTFDHFMSIGDNKVPVASHTALRYYRQQHAEIEHSYTVWLQSHES